MKEITYKFKKFYELQGKYEKTPFWHIIAHLLKTKDKEKILRQPQNIIFNRVTIKLLSNF